MIPQAKKWVSIWLAIGLILVFVQVVIGGITRLTDSGLSITEWDLVKGVIPPTNENEWNIAFEKYQTHAKKQYETIHSSMTLPEFKRIYFWEWFHRLWGRSMGIIFIIPFVFFLIKKWLPGWLIKRLLIVVGLAALAGAFGWIMVASGLNNDNRTWVSAYKLATHLIIATSLFSYLFYTFYKVAFQDTEFKGGANLKPLLLSLIVLAIVQIIFGGFMAGMRAGAIHPHWPIFMGDNHLVQIVTNPSLIQESEVINYEGSVWIKGVVQITHRVLAGLLVLLSLYFIAKAIKISKYLKVASLTIAFFIGLQYLLGVLTVIGIIGNKTPVFLGVAHQGVALLFLVSLLFAWFLISKKDKNIS